MILRRTLTLCVLPLACASWAGWSNPTTDFSRAEARERFPAGTASVRPDTGSGAFAKPAANLDEVQRLDFDVGRGLFRRLWVTAPSSTQASDGLGPLFNARSCLRCHIGNGRGHAPSPTQEGMDPGSLVLRIDIPAQNAQQQARRDTRQSNNIPDPVYGLQVQTLSIAGHHAEGRVVIRYDEWPVVLNGGETVSLRRPTYDLANPAYGALHAESRLSPRMAPPMIGLGMLAAISDADILANADPEDADGDGISGRANQVPDLATGNPTLGRFGLKAAMPNLAQQSQEAFNLDIGLSVPLYPHAAGDCTAEQRKCLTAPDGNSPQYENLEVPQQLVDLVLHHVGNIGVPQRSNIDDPTVLAGKRLFYATGCIACHKPKFVTRRDGMPAEHAAELIWPYTDLLLHDMGDGLADNRPEGRANGREWRTAPLWGVGHTLAVNPRAGFLHDGRARTLLEAILWHGGEAEQQRDAVVAMTPRQRTELLRFLESL